MSEKKRNFLKFIKSGTYTDKSGNRTNTDREASRVKKIDLDLETMKPASTKKMLTGGQAKIAAKAPPPDKITGEDFAVLREEKKKVKPVKAVLGIAAMGALGAKMLKDKNKKAMALPGVGAAALLAKKKKEMLGKRMGGVMKAKLGAEIKPKGPGVLRPKPTAGGKPLKPKPMKPNKKMGGGMIGGSQMPGYSKGKSVKVKCKLGRNKPTKMY